jgi:hypothetical protein
MGGAGPTDIGSADPTWEAAGESFPRRTTDGNGWVFPGGKTQGNGVYERSF